MDSRWPTRPFCLRSAFFWEVKPILYWHGLAATWKHGNMRKRETGVRHHRLGRWTKVIFHFLMKQCLHECFLNRIQHYINEVPSIGCFYGEELLWLQKSHFLGLVESSDSSKSANNMPRGACSVPECELCVPPSGGPTILPSLWSRTKSSEYEKLSSFLAFVPNVTGIKHILGRHWGRSGLRFLVCIWRESASHWHSPPWFCWAESRGVPTWRQWDCGREFLILNQFPQKLKGRRELLFVTACICFICNFYL